MREFVSNPKKVKITINGTSYEMRCPKIGESEVLDEKLSAAEPKEHLAVYKDFFKQLGLPKEAFDEMDKQDFLDFIKFVFSPNDQGLQSTKP